MGKCTACKNAHVENIVKTVEAIEGESSSAVVNDRKRGVIEQLVAAPFSFIRWCIKSIFSTIFMSFYGLYLVGKVIFKGRKAFDVRKKIITLKKENN